LELSLTHGFVSCGCLHAGLFGSVCGLNTGGLFNTYTLHTGKLLSLSLLHTSGFFDTYALHTSELLRLRLLNSCELIGVHALHTSELLSPRLLYTGGLFNTYTLCSGELLRLRLRLLHLGRPVSAELLRRLLERPLLPGRLNIPKLAAESLLGNALLHRLSRSSERSRCHGSRVSIRLLAPELLDGIVLLSPHNSVHVRGHILPDLGSRKLPGRIKLESIALARLKAAKFLTLHGLEVSERRNPSLLEPAERRDPGLLKRRS
jgi:hypothetical protein